MFYYIAILNTKRTANIDQTSHGSKRNIFLHVLHREDV